MSACVYWFSGTGNSLWIAKLLARCLDADLRPMAANIRSLQAHGHAPIVLVFPVYNHLIPYLVQRLLAAPATLAGLPIYAVCTYGDSPGIALEYLQKRIAQNGGTLFGGYAVKMPYNYVSPGKTMRSVFQPFRLRGIPAEAAEGMYAEAEQKLNGIADDMKAGKRGALETEHEGIERLSETLHLRDTLQKRFWLAKAGYRGKARMTSVECVQLMDTGFYATADCTGCKTCENVCPVGNIQFDTAEPAWRHRCEQCFACLQWCPAQAIQFGQGTQGGPRYHHPAIQLRDMMIQKQE